MKLLAISLCLGCLPSFAQDSLDRRSEIEEQVRHMNQFIQIRRAIISHQSFRLPNTPQDSTVSLTATDVTNSVNALRFTNVEIRMDGLMVQADALNYYWDSGEIRSYGEVSVKAVSPQ
jgi:hypothetical protein